MICSLIFTELMAPFCGHFTFNRRLDVLNNVCVQGPSHILRAVNESVAVNCSGLE